MSTATRTTSPPKTPTRSANWSTLVLRGGAKQAFPLDDRSALEIVRTPRPELSAPRGRFVYRPGTAPVPRMAGCQYAGPFVRHRRLVDIPAPGAAGVVFAFGSRFGGHALYVKDNRLHYVNDFVGAEEQLIVGTEDIPPVTT